MPADGDYQGREAMSNIDHPAILKTQQPAHMPHGAVVTSKPTEPLEEKKLLYRQYTCDPQGLAALCCELDSKGYEPVQIVPGFFGSGVQGPFHSAMGWTVLARLKAGYVVTVQPNKVGQFDPDMVRKGLDQLRSGGHMFVPDGMTIEKVGFSSSVPVVTDVSVDAAGKVQTKQEQIPVRELDEKTRASVMKGIDQAAAGQISEHPDFPAKGRKRK